jgi:hypothetical protein
MVIIIKKYLNIFKLLKINLNINLLAKKRNYLYKINFTIYYYIIIIIVHYIFLNQIYYANYF